MEKQLATSTYWLGMLSLVIAVVFRLVEVWVGPKVVGEGAMAVGHMPFFNGAMLFLMASIASTAYAWMKGQK